MDKGIEIEQGEDTCPEFSIFGGAEMPPQMGSGVYSLCPLPNCGATLRILSGLS